MEIKNTNWKEYLSDEFEKPYFIKLKNIIFNEYQNKLICPNYGDILKCFDIFNFEETKLVIIGQDPYHTKGMADGLAFSTSNPNMKPKSLVNLFKELEYDLNIKRTNFNLIDIAKQGVLLLNTYLTVEESKPLSHQNIGWEIFTDNVIQLISNKLSNVIFLLMGNNAISKEKLIDKNKHFILKTSHPSPFSFHISLKNSKIFSKINSILLSINKSILFW